MTKNNFWLKMLSLLLAVVMVASFVSCSSSSSVPTLSDPNNHTLTESVLTEKILDETILHEFITSEIYLEEIVVAEKKISELLLEEETITEVLLCKSVYVPQDHIDDFSEHSQTAELFGDNVRIASLLTKVAVGTGVIVTLVVLSKSGLRDPIASVVASAASESMKFAGTGAAIGSLYGGLTGAADSIDQTKRTSAVIGVATAIAGLIISVVSLVSEIPSGGSSSITTAVGIKLVIAGISVLTATAGTAYAGYNAIKTFTETDATNIDWDRIDWEKAGVAAAQKSIENAADGYMWGSIVGAVKGGADGYENYYKFSADHTTLKFRTDHTPVNDGHWSGARGESDFILDVPVTLKDGRVVSRITYKNGIPDFSNYQVAQVKIPNMTEKRLGKGNNFDQADTILAERWTKIKYLGRKWEPRDITQYRADNDLTWHEMNNLEGMQLVPTQVNDSFLHAGGVSEYKAMIGEEGGGDFD